jgi:hypothetical protein
MGGSRNFGIFSQNCGPLQLIYQDIRLINDSIESVREDSRERLTTRKSHQFEARRNEVNFSEGSSFWQNINKDENFR